MGGVVKEALKKGWYGNDYYKDGIFQYSRNPRGRPTPGPNGPSPVATNGTLVTVIPSSYYDAGYMELLKVLLESGYRIWLERLVR